MRDTLHIAMTGTTDINFTRVFNASPALLWRAITDPAIIPRWLWARDWPMTECRMDLRIGGAFRWAWCTGPDRVMGVSDRFLTVNAPHRLIHTEMFDEDWTGGETTVTQDLTEIAPQTTRLAMVVRYATEAARAGASASGMVEGMEDGYAKLDALIPQLISELRPGDFRIMAEGVQSLVVTRSFAAPKAAVIRAHTEAELLCRWIGSAEMPLEVCEIDAQVGGGFRYVWAMRDGTKIRLSGRFEAIGDDRIVHTELFEPDWTGGPARVVTTFAESAGRTTVQVEITYSDAPARDAVQASGMGEGMAGSYGRLEALL